VSGFWQFFWFVVEIFLFMAYLIVLFHVFADLFRDSKMGGWAKALWVVVLMVVPLLGSLVYLIARGRGMNERQAQQAAEAQRAAAAYIRETAGRAPAHEIAEARSLLDRGVLTPAEFESLKVKALQ